MVLRVVTLQFQCDYIVIETAFQGEDNRVVLRPSRKSKQEKDSYDKDMSFHRFTILTA